MTLIWRGPRQEIYDSCEFSRQSGNHAVELFFYSGGIEESATVEVSGFATPETAEPALHVNSS
jgi:hypothetical protein